ncbi:hypothetical protein O9929_13080 [Vibrio lentus]|nr:hypothetical protein [Vibrio lentus]
MAEPQVAIVSMIDHGGAPLRLTPKRRLIEMVAPSSLDLANPTQPKSALGYIVQALKFAANVA